MELAKHKTNMRKYETIKNINICMCEPAYNDNNNNRQTHRIINEHNKKYLRQMSQLPVLMLLLYDGS